MASCIVRGLCGAKPVHFKTSVVRNTSRSWVQVPVIMMPRRLCNKSQARRPRLRTSLGPHDGPPLGAPRAPPSPPSSVPDVGIHAKKRRICDSKVGVLTSGGPRFQNVLYRHAGRTVVNTTNFASPVLVDQTPCPPACFKYLLSLDRDG